MAAVHPSAYNVFVKNHDATNKMVVDFARDPKKFAVNQYVQVVPVKDLAGYYLKVTVEEAGRILYAGLENFVWHDGAEAPEGNDALEKFEYLEYRCMRRAFPFTIGDLTVEQATWDILAQHASIKARQSMTARTQLAVSALTTSGNYDSSHVLDVPSISGNLGKWTQSTTARQDIKRSLNTAAEVILDDTLGAIEIDDLVVVINSALAARLKSVWAPRGLVQRNQGKWYPGEPLPRWQIGLHWRRDGQPLWNDESLLADPWGGENAEVEPDAAQQLLAALAAGQ